jgi:hypothetical protein
VAGWQEGAETLEKKTGGPAMKPVSTAQGDLFAATEPSGTSTSGSADIATAVDVGTSAVDTEIAHAELSSTVIASADVSAPVAPQPVTAVAGPCERCTLWTDPPAQDPPHNWGICAIPLKDGRIVPSHRDCSCAHFTRRARVKSERRIQPRAPAQTSTSAEPT